MAAQLYLTEEQLTIVLAALSKFKRIDLWTGNRGGMFHQFGELPEVIRSEINMDISRSWSGRVAYHIFVDYHSASECYYFAFAENSEHMWLPLNEQASWPPNQNLLQQLAALTAPHVRKSKGYFSNRNQGIMLLLAAAGFSTIYFSGSFWAIFAVCTCLVAGICELSKYFFFDRWRHNRRRLRLLEAFVATGLVLHSASPSNVRQIRSV